MMDGLNIGGDAPQMDVQMKSESNETSNLSLSFSCSANMLANSN